MSISTVRIRLVFSAEIDLGDTGQRVLYLIPAGAQKIADVCTNISENFFTKHLKPNSSQAAHNTPPPAMCISLSLDNFVLPIDASVALLRNDDVVRVNLKPTNAALGSFKPSVAAVVTSLIDGSTTSSIGLKRKQVPAIESLDSSSSSDSDSSESDSDTQLKSAGTTKSPAILPVSQTTINLASTTSLTTSTSASTKLKSTVIMAKPAVTKAHPSSTAKAVKVALPNAAIVAPLTTDSMDTKSTTRKQLTSRTVSSHLQKKDHIKFNDPDDDNAETHASKSCVVITATSSATQALSNNPKRRKVAQEVSVLPETGQPEVEVVANADRFFLAPRTQKRLLQQHAWEELEGQQMCDADFSYNSVAPPSFSTTHASTISTDPPAVPEEQCLKIVKEFPVLCLPVSVNSVICYREVELSANWCPAWSNLKIAFVRSCCGNQIHLSQLDFPSSQSLIIFLGQNSQCSPVPSSVAPKPKSKPPCFTAHHGFLLGADVTVEFEALFDAHLLVKAGGRLPRLDVTVSQSSGKLQRNSINTANHSVSSANILISKPEAPVLQLMPPVLVSSAKLPYSTIMPTVAPSHDTADLNVICSATQRDVSMVDTKTPTIAAATLNTPLSVPLIDSIPGKSNSGLLAEFGDELALKRAMLAQRQAIRTRRFGVPSATHNTAILIPHSQLTTTSTNLLLTPTIIPVTTVTNTDVNVMVSQCAIGNGIYALESNKQPITVPATSVAVETTNMEVAATVNPICTTTISAKRKLRRQRQRQNRGVGQEKTVDSAPGDTTAAE